jgi:menaquinone-dependent protoporphyrinogen oxidase
MWSSQKRRKQVNTILVTYATRAGSTYEIAARVAEVLRAEGAAMEVKPVSAVHELQGYEAVVLGSAIRMGRWLPEAVEFVAANHQALSHIPTAYFVVSGLLRTDTPEVRREVLAFLDPVHALLEPVRIGLFAGKLDYRTIDGFDRSIAEAVSSAEGDWRDWQAIDAWAHDLLPALVHA